MTYKSMLYTRKGDSGKSSLYDGTRTYKSDTIFDVLGKIDSLNQTLGKSLYEIRHASSTLNTLTSDDKYENRASIDYELYREIINIIKLLMEIATEVATPNKRKYVNYLKSRTLYLEERINVLDASTPELTNFIALYGPPNCTVFHEARIKTREVERKMVKYNNEVTDNYLYKTLPKVCYDNLVYFNLIEDINKYKIRDEVLMYINRLSDYFFALARNQYSCDEILIKFN